MVDTKRVLYRCWTGFGFGTCVRGMHLVLISMKAGGRGGGKGYVKDN